MIIKYKEARLCVWAISPLYLKIGPQAAQTNILRGYLFWVKHYFYGAYKIQRTLIIRGLVYFNFCKNYFWYLFLNTLAAMPNLTQECHLEWALDLWWDMGFVCWQNLYITWYTLIICYFTCFMKKSCMLRSQTLCLFTRYLTGQLSIVLTIALLSFFLLPAEFWRQIHWSISPPPPFVFIPYFFHFVKFITQ